MVPLSQKHKQLSPEAEIAFMEFCGIRIFLKRTLANETQPDDDVDGFFARLHEEIPFYIAYRFFPELRNADVTVDELLTEDRVPNAIFYDLQDIMQELMAEGVPTNPFPLGVWRELKDALEAQERPVIPDTMSDTGGPETTGSLGLVPPTGKWSKTKLANTDNAPDGTDLDNPEQKEQEESLKSKATGTGLYDTDEEEAVDRPKAQLPKLEVIERGATAIALASIEAQSRDTPEQHVSSSLLDATNTVPPPNKPPPGHQTEPAPRKSLLDPTAPAFIPSNPPQNSPQSEIELLQGSYPSFPTKNAKHRSTSTDNPPPPEHIGALDFQLAHVQIERTADNARVQHLEQQIHDLYLERERGLQSFAEPSPQRLLTQSPFGDGRGFPSGLGTDLVGFRPVRRLGSYSFASGTRSPPPVYQSSGFAGNAPLVGGFAEVEPAVEWRRNGALGDGAQEGRGTEDRRMVEEEEDGDEV
ncbi:hypothetical protein MMC27_001020 [Xylographa pallens]|nr:hypothetical protein [Xylographa pallens]